ncbi:MAG: hypothetical protein ACXWID_17000 [Pyrinomonadaceae bacterium]
MELRHTQRYFHFVALTGSARDRIRSRFYTDQRIDREKPIKISADASVQKLRVESQYQYYRGFLDNNDPDQLIFDGVLFNHTRLGISLLGFPFKKMIADMVSRLVHKFNLPSTGNFVNVDMRKFIEAHENDSDQSYAHSQFFLAGVDLMLYGDRYLSTVKLQGDKPLESDLYIEYFKDKIHENESRLEKCTMKCKISEDSQPDSPRIISSFHIDKFGNFKIYVHSDGRNLMTLPRIFDFLDSIGCLSETPHPPTMNISEEEE